MSATRYPVYVPSRDRAKVAARNEYATIPNLVEDDVPFRLVLVPGSVAEYAEALGWAADDPRILVLPSDGMNLLDTRNWIRDHAEASGAAKHWQLDDNINEFRRLYRGRRIPCSADLALGACEDFVDRYSNVAVAGLNYQMFVTRETRVPFYLNVHVYSCTLVNHAWPGRWRLVYNDDTDLCLQALADGWCTVLLNAFMANKQRTMTLAGGNTNQLYEGDGRLVMAETLARAWPGVVTVSRRFGRPQHVIDWTKFDTQLEPLPEIGEIIEEQRDRAIRLREVRPVRSETLRQAVGRTD